MAEEKKEEEKKEEVKKEVPKEEPEKKEKPKREELSKAEKKEKVEVPKKFKALVEEIEKMSVLDLSELVKVLEKKFGVSAAASKAAAPAVSATGAEASAPAEEKSVFNIELKEVGPQKIQVIKLVRDITQKGLKDSKDLVDAVEKGPQVVKENVKKEEAEDMKKKFEAVGGKIELK